MDVGSSGRSAGIVSPVLLDDSAPPWRENTASGVGDERSWAALWHSRELIGYFALRDLKLRYRQAVLGVVWVVAQPIASVAVFTLVFSELAGISSEGVPYPVFALVGMLTWTYFSSVVLTGSSALVSNASLVTKVYFPRMAAPASGLLPPAVDLGISLLLFAAVAVYYRVFSGVRLLVLPIWFLMLAGTAFGVTLWLSALNVRYRDVQHAVAPVLQLWLFASPVAYPATLLSGWQELVYSINPVVGVLELGRWALLGTPWPGWPLLVSTASAAAVLVGGLRYFNRAQRSFADVI